MNIRRERTDVKLNSGEGVGVTFCLRSLDSKGGTVKAANAVG